MVTPTRQPVTTEHQVTITPNAKRNRPPTVNPPSLTVRQNEEVIWDCTTGDDFTVAFTNSLDKPFARRVFDKANNRSGSPTGQSGTHKYCVIVGGGCADPDIIIP